MFDKTITSDSVKLFYACGLIGAYQSHLQYAIDTLTGKSSADPKFVSDYLQKEVAKLELELAEKIFEVKK
tara:strand:- start:98 stop:307 length:210 start_codon:yes stop_codon:yes gene_type:complete